MIAAPTRRPRVDVPDHVAQESDFWAFVGAVAIPVAGVALLGLAIGIAPNLLLHDDRPLVMQVSVDGDPVVGSPREQLPVVSEASRRHDPSLAEAPPAEPARVEPSPVAPTVAVPAGRAPLVTVERDAPPGRIAPAPQPTDRAESAPLQLEASEPDADVDVDDLPRDIAAVPHAVPTTPEPPALPAPPAPTLEAAVAPAPGPERPASPQPEPPVGVVREPPPAMAAPASPPIVSPAPLGAPPAVQPPPLAILRPGPTTLEQLLPPGRGSGHKLLARLAATESVEGCDRRELPYFRVIDSNAVPERLPAGGRFSHRVVYALCPADAASQLTAIVTREVRSGAEVVLSERTDGFRLRPGTWASDEELTVPPNTAPGRYTVSTTVIFGGRAWTERTDLLVE